MPAPEDPNVLERRRQAAQLRLAGVDNETIYLRLKHMGYGSADHVRVDLLRARRRSRARTDETIEDLRTLNVERLERLLAGVWGKAVGGDVNATLAAGRLIERICDLQGLKPPTQVQLTARIEMESTAVAEGVLAAIEALGLPPEQRVMALDAAQERLLAIAKGPDVIAGEVVDG
jgi:hypothetical protein